MDVSSSISQVYFIKLDLTDAGGKLLSTNFYWQSVAQDDFTGLGETAYGDDRGDRVLAGGRRQHGTYRDAHEFNEHDCVDDASAATPEAVRQARFPVFYSDNYITLVPGESRTVTITAATKDLGGDAPLIAVDGYNVDVRASDSHVSVAPNLNAQPEHWPASQIVPDMAK